MSKDTKPNTRQHVYAVNGNATTHQYELFTHYDLLFSNESPRATMDDDQEKNIIVKYAVFCRALQFDPTMPICDSRGSRLDVEVDRDYNVDEHGKQDPFEYYEEAAARGIIPVPNVMGASRSVLIHYYGTPITMEPQRGACEDEAKETEEKRLLAQRGKLTCVRVNKGKQSMTRKTTKHGERPRRRRRGLTRRVTVEMDSLIRGYQGRTETT